MQFPRYDLRVELSIRQIITFFYMELPKRFWTPGESHDFWEMAYVDNGYLEIIRGTQRHALGPGDLIFYAPNEFHAGRALNESAPTLIILSFECDSEAMHACAGKIVHLEEEEKKLLSTIIREGREAFDPPVDSPRMHRPRQRLKAAFGSEQMIKNHLEILLIQLIRRGDRSSTNQSDSIAMANYNDTLVGQMIDYMRANIRENLTIEQLCSAFGMGRTRMVTLFKTATGLGTIAYFQKLKIEHAKTIIRHRTLRMTEVAEEVGFASVHHFSRSFKKETGLTPTEYARSVNARALRWSPEMYPELN
ncbi:AraC family transcriptional regulator [Paenibacillus sp. GYB003]|uniref:AraC family transcriptional regulator n=1 Tax=Paenibacillus sp. GYB003 TaxID=2994392 RepID=UPI002F96AF9C